MIDRTCFAYYSSNNSFCSTQALSTSLVENVFFLFAGNARLHEKHRLFSFFFFFFFVSFLFLFCRALNKQNNITNTWEISPGIFKCWCPQISKGFVPRLDGFWHFNKVSILFYSILNVPGHIAHLDRSRMDTERKNDIPFNANCCHCCRFVGMWPLPGTLAPVVRSK